MSNNKKICISIITILIILLIVLTIRYRWMIISDTGLVHLFENESIEAIDIIRFIENEKTNIQLSNHEFHSYGINDEITNEKTKNIWVTYDFLKNKENAEVIKKFVDNGYALLIQDTIEGEAAALEALGADEESIQDAKNSSVIPETTPTAILVKQDSEGLYESTFISIEEGSDYYKLLFDSFSDI